MVVVVVAVETIVLVNTSERFRGTICLAAFLIHSLPLPTCAVHVYGVPSHECGCQLNHEKLVW